MDPDALNIKRHKQLTFKRKGDALMVLAYHTIGNGTTFGGIRLLPSGMIEKGIKDALRLSEAMTYKLALINEPYGGSKAAVLIPEHGKTNEFLHDIGELIEEEKGKLIPAIDFGFDPDDAKIIQERTKYLMAVKDSPFGQSGVTTAYGVVEGIKATLNEVFGSEEIKGRSFGVQGLGSVGKVLADELIKAGGNVHVADLNVERLKGFEGRAKVVPPEGILSLEVDVICPCGPAYVINSETIPKLKCKAIAGGANCQLEDEVEDDKRLSEKGILVAPDYAINAGGVIQGVEEFRKGTLKDAMSRLPLIAENLKEIYRQSKEKGIGTYAVAKQLAIDRLNKSP